MSCKSFEELIALYVEGDLDSSQARDVEGHLKFCLSCQRLLAGLEASQAAVRGLAAETLDADSFNIVRQRVMEEVQRRQTVRPVWWRFLPPPLSEWRPAWVAALAVLVVIGFLLQWQVWRKPKGSDKPDTSALTVQEGNPRVETPNSPERIAAKPQQASAELGAKQFARRHKTVLPQKIALAVGVEPEVVDEDSQPPVEQGTILAPEPPQPADLTPESPPPLVIKLITDDPNIVIVWLVDQDVHHN
jgi:putative zinc finger protein